MAISGEKINKKRLRSSNFTVVISISLVLFLIGLTTMLMIRLQDYFNSLKEKYVVEVFLNDFIDKKDENEVYQMQLDFKDEMKKAPFAKDAKYISKTEAYKIAEKEIGPDKVNIIEEKIFPASVQITLRSQYVNQVRVDSLSQIISKNPIVDEVKKDDDLINQVFDNIDTIMMWLLFVAFIFLIISIVLINNSIRLKIFSKRFTIKTMQLVGAKWRFIVMPFIVQAFWLGLIGAIVAIGLLAVVWYYFTNAIKIPFFYPEDYMVVGGIVALGVVISIFSTWIATRKFLKLRTDDLYYS